MWVAQVQTGWSAARARLWLARVLAVVVAAAAELAKVAERQAVLAVRAAGLSGEEGTQPASVRQQIQSPQGLAQAQARTMGLQRAAAQIQGMLEDQGIHERESTKRTDRQHTRRKSLLDALRLRHLAKLAR